MCGKFSRGWRESAEVGMSLQDSGPIWQRPVMEMTASSLKLRAKALGGRKAISYQTCR